MPILNPRKNNIIPSPINAAVLSLFLFFSFKLFFDISTQSLLKERLL